MRAQERDESAQRRDLSVPKQLLALFDHRIISVKNPLMATMPQSLSDLALTPNPQLPLTGKFYAAIKKNKIEKKNK